MADTVNVLAPELRNVIKKEVDYIPGAWVEFFDDITMGEIKSAEKVKDSSDIDSGLDLLLFQISDWNFSDDKGKLPVNKASLERLPSKLIKWLTQAQNEVLSSLEEKKSE